MYRLSSNTTIFWKLFVPVFYITFFGILNMVAFSVDQYDLPFLANPITKLILLSSYILFIILMSFTIIKLKRVEADDNFIYVTDYFKTYRYAKEDIQDITTSDFIIFKSTSLTMKEKTKMGKKIRYIGDWTSQKI
jgi:hypothetical protein